jgi:uncharacterized membrane protein YeaQ/YmgE (transglycosylase-associated protein family)
MITYLILVAISGLFVGALARLALPGRDPMGLLTTMLVGITGSLAAGLVYAALFHRNGGGILLSVLFSTAIVYLIRRSRGGSLTRPGADRHDRFGQPRGGRFGQPRRGAGLFR